MADYTAHQLDNARTAIRVGKEKGISPRGQIGGLSCGLVETNLKVYANPKDPPTMSLPHVAVGHDALSSGVLQQQPGKTWDAQPSWWGTVQCRMDPACAYGQFYDRLKATRINGHDYNHLGISMGDFVQRVQQSSFPTRYNERMREAQALYDRLFLEGAGIAPPHVALRPQFEEFNMFGHGASPRSRTPINFLFHTEEGNSTAEGLARYCQGQNNVSYHYTVRDRKVYNVVDTDMYSWSVLAANAFTINLCFAGSRAGWSRAEWLKREADIEIACYLAVQDCRKYGFPANVIVPPYVNAPGIADHKYVTEELRIGNHTDCGSNFPWDKVIHYVNLYTGAEEDDMFTDHDRFLLQVLAEKRHGSRSALRKPGEGEVDTVAGFVLNDDGHDHLTRTIEEVKLGVPRAVELCEEVATTQLPDRAEDAVLARAILDAYGPGGAHHVGGYGGADTVVRDFAGGAVAVAAKRAAPSKKRT